jgi:hypothetical protein
MRALPRDSLHRAELPAAVWAARDSIGAFLAGRPGITLARGSGRFVDPSGLRLLTTCRLTIRGSFKTTPYPHDAETRLGEFLGQRGWKADHECAADGPDGTLWGVRRGGVRCLVAASWDGGDDSDSTYVPRDDYEVIVDCLVDSVDVCPH